MKSAETHKREILLVLHTVTVVFLLLGLFIAIPYLAGSLISGGMTLLFLRKHRSGTPTAPVSTPSAS